MKPPLLEPLELAFETLPNGARVVLAPLNHLHRVAISVVVGVGSRDEPEGVQGVSHLLEHLMFRGTPKRPTQRDVVVAFEELGADFNAFTTREITSYEVSLPPECLDAGLALLAEVLLTPRLVGIAAEREIIREEILSDFDDELHCIYADDLLMEALFGTRDLGLSIAGTPTTIDRLTSAHVKRHYQRFYRGPNMVIAVAGALGSVSHVAKRIAARFSGLNPEPIEARGDAQTLEMPHARVRYRRFEGPGQTELTLGVRSVASSAPEFPVVELVARLLDDGMSSRLQHRLVEELGLVYDVECYLSPYRELSVFSLRASTRHRRVRRVLETLYGVLEALAESGPGEDELERVRRRQIWEMRELLDRPEALSAWLTEALIRGERVDLKERCAELAAVSSDAVRERTRALFFSGAQQVVLVGQLGNKALSSVQSTLARVSRGEDVEMEAL